MKNFLKGMIKRPITICSFIIVLLVLGIYSIINMNVNLLPDMNMPMLTAQFTYVGANAKTVEEEVILKVEDALTSVSKVRNITSYSLDNGGAVAIFFDYDVDAKDKVDEVRDKLSLLTLPSGVSDIKVQQFDLNGDAIATLAVYGKDIDILKEDASKLASHLTNIEGVNDVKIVGSYEKKIEINAIEGLDIASLLIVQALSTEGLNIPFGSMYEDNELIYIRNASDATSVEDIKALPVSFTFREGVFDKINEFKDLVKEYEGWTLTEFEANIDTKLVALMTDMGVGASDVDPAVLQRLLINYKPVLRQVKQRYIDSDGNPLKDENGDVLTYKASDFKYIYDVLELKALAKLNLSEDLINLLIDVDFTNVRKNGDDTATLLVRLDKIASVEEKEVFASYSKYNNEASITLEVYSTQNANTTRIVKEVNKRIASDEYQSNIVLLDDRASFISESINNILVSIVIGAVLAVAVIYIFIRKIRTSLIIAITLPLSVIAALLGLYLMDISMNMVSLGGLAVGIGMLVDNSIVVLESILKHKDTGKSAFAASVDGTFEVAPSLFASTLTNVLVFIPILFIKGMTKMIFNDLVYSIGFSMIMSLIVAVSVIPCLYALLYNRKDKEGEEIKEIIENPPLKKYELKYQNFLKKILSKRALICIIDLLIFLASSVLVFTSDIEFLPSIDKGIVEVNLSYDNDKTLEEVRGISDVALNKLSNLENLEFISATIGEASITDTSLSTKIRLQLDHKKQKTKDRLDEIRQIFNTVDGIKNAKVIEIDGVVAEVTSSFASISLSIEGEDIATLKEIANKIEAKLLENEKVSNAYDDIQEENKQLAIKIDKTKCAEYGIDYTNVVMLLRVGIASYKAASIKTEDGELECLVSFCDSTRSSFDKILSTILGFHNNHVICLSDVATTEEEITTSLIKRSDSTYQVLISVEVNGLTNGEISKIMKDVSEDVLKDYDGYKYVESGVSSYLSDAFSGLVVVLVISFLLLYLVLACQFGSLLKPLIVIMAIPFSFTGGFLALAVTRTSLNVVSFVGIIMLMGVIVNAAIVMIDKIDMLAKNGMDIKDAVTYGPASRLRAICMSTLTTVLALIPLSLGIGEGSALMQPMGISVLGGLLLGTMVTLIIIPCFYCIVKRVKFNKTEEEN